MYKGLNSLKVMKDILLKNGFKLDKEIIPGVKSWECISPEGLRIRVSEGLTNMVGRDYHVQVDTPDFCSVGGVDIRGVEDFNLFMEILGSKFRLEE